MLKRLVMKNPLQQGFIWGRVIARHAIGEYEIVEYAERDLDSNEKGEIGFHPYIAGDDSNSSFSSLDEAIVAAIAYKREGVNHRADGYFFRMTTYAE